MMPKQGCTGSSTATAAAMPHHVPVSLAETWSNGWWHEIEQLVAQAGAAIKKGNPDGVRESVAVFVRMVSRAVHGMGTIQEAHITSIAVTC